jgi:hypothetical protein
MCDNRAMEEQRSKLSEVGREIGKHTAWHFTGAPLLDSAAEKWKRWIGSIVPSLASTIASRIAGLGWWWVAVITLQTFGLVWFIWNWIRWRHIATLRLQGKSAPEGTQELASETDGVEKRFADITRSTEEILNKWKQETETRQSFELSTMNTFGLMGKHIDGIHGDAEGLKANLSRSVERIARICDGLPYFAKFMSDITTLITQVDLSAELLQQVALRYPDAAVTKAPFSSAWWRTDAPNCPPLATTWSLVTKWHVDRCREIATLYVRHPTDLLDLRLQEYCNSWNCSEDLSRCNEILKSQKAKLFALRQDYAASFSDRMQRDTIS